MAVGGQDLYMPFSTLTARQYHPGINGMKVLRMAFPGVRKNDENGSSNVRNSLVATWVRRVL